MGMIIHIDGLRFAGKTSLVPALAATLFQKGFSVAIIPEWRFIDNGPTDIYEWIEKVIIERKHSRNIAASNNADIIIVDRSFVGLEAFVACSFPDKLDYFYSTIGDALIPDMEIYLFAEKDIIKERAVKSQDKNYVLNDDKISDYYKKVYERLSINPFSFDTTHINTQELANQIHILIINKIQENLKENLLC